MILRKPFAFFIKMFKPIHIFMALMILYLLNKTNNILEFFNRYIYSLETVVGLTMKGDLISNEMFIIPIILIVLCLLILGIMFNKQKPILFYVFFVFSFLVVIIITIYSSNFLVLMEKSIMSIKLVKMHHDLVLINIIIECINFIVLIVRGLGINFKKFNFDSDIMKFDINASDKEEIELNINVDLDLVRRNRKKKLRYFKYIYKENKIVFISSIICLFIICLISIFLIVKNKTGDNIEGVEYNINKFNLIVNKSMLLKENFRGEKLTDNSLVVVDISLRTDFFGISLFSKDFNLEITDTIFSVVTRYNEDLLDLGMPYSNNNLTKEYEHYLLIFEIPDKYSNSEMLLSFNNQGEKTKIRLSPQDYKNEKVTELKTLGEKINFEKTMGQISFAINKFEMSNYFLINYNYCVDEQCLLSKEYIKPSISGNFDKIVIKFEVDYENTSKLNIDSFYEFFNKFGNIYYKKNEKWFLQTGNFEEIKSTKVNQERNVYIGVNSEIYYADEIKLVFNIRNSSYEYILK